MQQWWFYRGNIRPIKGMRKGSILLACLNESFVYNRKSSLFRKLFRLWTKEWIYLGSTISGQEEIYIFIDEVQLIEEWEKSVNSYSQDYTEEYELFISGSNSRMLSGELATLLSGRYVQFPVYPFSYQEYTEIRHLEQNRESYMNTGGIPELLSCPKSRRCSAITCLPWRTPSCWRTSANATAYVTPDCLKTFLRFL